MSTLTSKGRVTVPIEVRRRLALHTGDRLRWTIREDGVVEIARENVPEIADVTGMLARPGRRPRAKTLAAMDRGIARAVADRDAASRGPRGR